MSPCPSQHKSGRTNTISIACEERKARRDAARSEEEREAIRKKDRERKARKREEERLIAELEALDFDLE